MDNFLFDITSCGRSHFDIAMGLAFSNYKEAVAFCNHPILGLVLLWCTDGNKQEQMLACSNVAAAVERLPYKMNAKAATEFAWHWLLLVNYEKEPDIDGSYERGFRIYNGAWGHVGGSWRAFVAIKPEWALYGK